MGAKAEVRSSTERDVGVRVADEIEVIGVGKHFRIAVRSAEPDDNLVANSYVLVTECGVGVWPYDGTAAPVKRSGSAPRWR